MKQISTAVGRGVAIRRDEHKQPGQGVSSTGVWYGAGEYDQL